MGVSGDGITTKAASTRAVLWGYVGTVLTGAALIIATAVNQPYNENEWAQIGPYGSSDPGVVTSGTRQPPLDALLGAAFQHLFGEGQLRQRLPPALYGVGTLILAAVLLRRMRPDWLGVAGLGWLATAPVFVRYSAYIRPYALPLLLMMVCAWAGTRWLASGARRWLAAALGAAVLLPLARVPEPVVFLTVSALVLGISGWRDRATRARRWALGVSLILGLLVSGLPMFLALRAKTSDSAFDPAPTHVRERLRTGVHELLTHWVPLLGEWFPWWPVTLVLVMAALALPQARARLLSTWWWLPSLAAPLAFAAAFHLVNKMPFELLPYRARFLYFFAPSLLLVVLAVGEDVTARVARRWEGRGRALAGVGLVGLVVALQLPLTVRVVTRNDTVDFAQAGAELRAVVPAEGIVLFDTPAPGFDWRQPFVGKARYLQPGQRLVSVSKLAHGKNWIGATGPIYLLVMDPECSSSILCDKPVSPWSPEVAGFHVVRRFDRFRIFAPDQGQSGAAGAAVAIQQLAASYPRDNRPMTLLALARVLYVTHRPAQARAAAARACASPGVLANECRDLAQLGVPPRYAEVGP